MAETIKRKSKFPLTLHPTGQWCKKIRGKLHYFGTDKDQAHARYLEVASDLHAGRQSRQKIGGEALTVKHLANHYLAFQETRMEGQEVTPKHFRDCHDGLRLFMSSVGGNTPVSELTPDALVAFRTKLLKRYAPSTVNRQLTIVKGAFNYAADVQLIERLPPIRKTLARVPVKRLRHHKAQKQREHGRPLFTPEEIKRLIDSSDTQMQAMILLGINAGFGNKDCADLTIKDVDFGAELIDYLRGKTGISRTVPLWPVTLQALRGAIAARPKPAAREDARRVFLTPRGLPWVRTAERQHRKPPNDGRPQVVAHDELNKQFEDLLKRLQLKRVGVGFYALRHTHATLADKARDVHAQKRIMGHAIPGMLGEYIEEIEIGRLKMVASIVHEAIYGSPAWPARVAQPQQATGSHERTGGNNTPGRPPA